MLRAEEGLERLAVGIGITLRELEAAEDGRAGEEGRNVSGREESKEVVSALFLKLNNQLFYVFLRCKSKEKSSFSLFFVIQTKICCTELFVFSFS